MSRSSEIYMFHGENHHLMPTPHERNLDQGQGKLGFKYHREA